MGIVLKSLAGILLLEEGIRDWRQKQISLPVCFVAAVLGILLQINRMPECLWSMGSGAAVGVFLLLIALLTRESIGYGDGVIILTAGILLGGRQTVMLLFFSLLFCGICAGGMLLFGRGGRKKRMAFVPFMMPAFVLVVLGG